MDELFPLFLMKANVVFRFLFCVFLSSVVVRGGVMVAPLFQDHAVVQRDKPIPVWGRASPNEKIAVSFAGQTRITRADHDGRWSVELGPLPASIQPAEMRIEGSTTLVLRDILIGDVWLCSGQSNMAWSVGASANPDLEIGAANWPLIRQIKFPWAVADTPQERVDGEWAVCSPGTVATFTAVGYYFARDIHRELRVPIGIVNCSVGGSSIEAWMGREALASDPEFEVVHSRWQRLLALSNPLQTAEYEKEFASWRAEVARTKLAADGSVAPARPLPPVGRGHLSTPGGFYNGMLAPCVPYGLKGILWYQGEANAGRANEYKKLFSAMVADWRRVFRQGDLPFYWVQLPNFNPKDVSGMTWAQLRDAQTQSLDIPASGQAVTLDIGSLDNGHPYNKQDVGARLALLAKARTYGLKVDDSGPRFAGVERQGSGLRVRFSHAERGLEARGALVGFEVAGPDRWYWPADAAIHDDSVVVSARQVAEPVHVRYAWSNAPKASLFEMQGLPAGPFQATAGRD